MRIVLFGQQAFGKDVFEKLREAGEEVVAVSTPRLDGRSDPLAEAAQEAALPNIETPSLRRDGPFQEYLDLQPELLVFAFVTDIVRKRVLDAATQGAIQYHPSLLPEHRGRTAMNWPIIEGKTKTGLTIFWVDEGIDTGPIVLQREVEIGPEDSVGSLYFGTLYQMGVDALVEATGMVRDGSAPRIEQDHERATYEAPCDAEHAKIDWSRPGRMVFNHIRGCDPQPGATALLNGKSLKLFNSHYRPGAPNEPPGTVMSVVDGAAEIAAIGGTLTIERAQPDGTRKTAAGDHMQVGDTLERPA